MLRSKQYSYQLFSVVLIYVLFQQNSVRANSSADSLRVTYKTSINATFDKSLVTRLIFSTQNSFVLQNQRVSFEPILNYRLGYVQPAGKPKSDLENDVFVLLKNHFGYQNKVFTSILLGYENSPNIRRLDNRVIAGGGIGSFPLRSKNHLFQFMLYGLYERSDFELLDYEIFRLMPFIKGNHVFEKQHFGLAYSIQPFIALTSTNNQRVRGTLRPYIKITPQLDFSIYYECWYESQVSGIQPRNISVFLLGVQYSSN